MSMKYKTGMFGGSFDPLHTGHIHDIIRAAAMCRELYVVISWCRGRESTSKEMRYRWILNSTRHLPNVMIRMVEDQALTKEEYDTPGYWEQGARDIKAVIGKPIDAVFCGTDYLVNTVTTSTTIHTIHCSIRRLTLRSMASTDRQVLMLSIKGRFPPNRFNTSP